LKAFIEINKVCAECPKSKIALLKKAYRKKPSHGFCPAPESAWGKKALNELETLEHLLHYFHVELESAVAALGNDDKRLMFLANVDISAADSFLAAEAKKKNQREAVLQATSKYYYELQEVAKQKLSCYHQSELGSVSRRLQIRSHRSPKMRS
jgi:hypothetical protein